jgi:hypothetical protein
MLWKIFVEFKNIVLEEKLSNKYKNIHENFSGVRISMVLGLHFLLGYPKTLKFRDLQGALRVRKFLWPFLKLLDNFSSKMMLQEVFSEHEIRVFIENGLGSFQTFLILQIWDKEEMIKKF